jgi:hypothetical protein
MIWPCDAVVFFAACAYHVAAQQELGFLVDAYELTAAVTAFEQYARWN